MRCRYPRCLSWIALCDFDEKYTFCFGVASALSKWILCLVSVLSLLDWKWRCCLCELSYPNRNSQGLEASEQGPSNDIPNPRLRATLSGINQIFFLKVNITRLGEWCSSPKISPCLPKPRSFKKTPKGQNGRRKAYDGVDWRVRNAGRWDCTCLRRG
jgi:hypothetical protein